jgi:hypothetical protein
MEVPALAAQASRRFTYADLCQCGETWRATQVSNAPLEPDTYRAIERLCVDILEPVQDVFGPLTLTYGFGGPALARRIGRRIAPRIDQHAGHERTPRGDFICPRLGQAVDFIATGASSREVARFIAAQTPFDRLYFYGDDRPVHVSCGPDESRSLVLVRTVDGRRIPRLIAPRDL